MAMQKPPAGTRGSRTPPRIVTRVVMPIMTRIHRLTRDRFNGMDLLYLTTVGARSGQTRTHPVARFEDGASGWFVVASAAGAAQHPAWYHNIAAHPDDVRAEVGKVSHRVRVEQLEGEARQAAWLQITRKVPGFSGYEDKTDRTIPVLRLTPVG